MSQSPDAPTSFDPDAVRAKYLAERDKRLVPGRSEIRDLRRDEFFKKFRGDPFTPVTPREALSEEADVAIIGAGLAGVVVGAKLREAGVQKIRLIDEAGGIGGTWYWNRYPGVMCDVESYIYMPMLEELDYVPSRKYAFGDEIRTHLQSIAEEYDLVDDALFHTRIDRREWDEASDRWVIRTDRGDEIKARFVVMAVGILNLMKLPAIPGMDLFKGKSFHTARWDYEYTGGRGDVLPPVYGGGEDGRLSKLADKTVAIMGTGASAIQAIPALAESAKKLYVFQRTPSAVGVRGNRFTDESELNVRPGWQWDRMLNFQKAMDGTPAEKDLVDDGWTHHFGPTRRPPGIEGLTPEEIGLRIEQFDFEVMEVHRRRIDETVSDPHKAAILKPYYRYICKRPCFHDEYLSAFNRPNVELIDCPSGIERVTERGLIVNGEDYEVDCIVYATGFEAEMTPLSRRAGHDVIGCDGARLADKWDTTQASLFGMMTRGFPNMFIMPAPGQQAVVTVNHTLITVVGADHIAATVKILKDLDITRVDVSEGAEADWCDKIRADWVDASPILSTCTPSRVNAEGDLSKITPDKGSYGGGLGDFFGFLELLSKWRDKLASGDSAGLEIERSIVEV